MDWHAMFDGIFYWCSCDFTAVLTLILCFLVNTTPNAYFIMQDYPHPFQPSSRANFEEKKFEVLI